MRPRPGCRLIVTPGVVPRLSSNRNFRIPDLGVTCSPPSAELVVPDPVLLVEILSSSNEVATWRNVWAYTTIPTVTEILAVRSTRIEAELLRRLPDGNWPKEPEILRAGDSTDVDQYRVVGGAGIILRDFVAAVVGNGGTATDGP